MPNPINSSYISGLAVDKVRMGDLVYRDSNGNIRVPVDGSDIAGRELVGVVVQMEDDNVVVVQLLNRYNIHMIPEQIWHSMRENIRGIGSSIVEDMAGHNGWSKTSLVAVEREKPSKCRGVQEVREYVVVSKRKQKRKSK